MLKVEAPAFHLIPPPPLPEKCGEIFSQNFKDFTIYCCFCNLQLPAFEDFRGHVLDVHFENDFLKEQTVGGGLITEWANRARVDNPIAGEVELKQEDLPANGNGEFEDFINLRELVATEEADEKEEQEATESELSLDNENSGSNFEEDSRTDHSLLKVLHLGKEDMERKKRKKLKSKTLNNSKEDETTAEENSGDETELNRKEKEYSCADCAEIFSRKKSMHEHVLAVHKGYKCSICDKRYRSQLQLKVHTRSHSEEKPKLPCPNIDCRRTFSCAENLQRHLELHTLPATFVCAMENCQKAFPTEQHLLIHSRTHKKYNICDICGYSCCSNASLLIHKRRHTGEKPFSCEICQKSFISKSALAEHMHVHRRTGNHVCRICNASFVNDRYLYRHMIIHNSGRTTKCPLCDKALPSARGLNNHMRLCSVLSNEITKNKEQFTATENSNDVSEGVQDKESNESEKILNENQQQQQQSYNSNGTLKFPCPRPDCDRSFANEKNLNRHLKVHTTTSTGLFVCSIENCDKTFPTEARLRAHIRAHDKCKVCDICGYRCAALATLIIHKRVHTGERPFSCEVCEKTFISKTALLEHMNVHTTIRPHVCEICQADFTSFKALRRHKKTHTNERNYKCKLCDKAFKTYNGLDNHMRCMHREPKTPGAIETRDILIADNFEEYALKKLDAAPPVCKLKKYQCQDCSKTFKRLNGLDNHLRQFHGATDSSIVESLENSDKKKFKCNLCNKKFTSLRRHNLTHKDDRKFACKLCDNIYRTYNGLNSHMLRIHSVDDNAGDNKDLCNVGLSGSGQEVLE